MESPVHTSAHVIFAGQALCIDTQLGNCWNPILIGGCTLSGVEEFILLCCWYRGKQWSVNYIREERHCIWCILSYFGDVKMFGIVFSVVFAQAKSEFEILVDYLDLLPTSASGGSGSEVTGSACLKWAIQDPTVLVKAWCHHINNFAKHKAAECKVCHGVRAATPPAIFWACWKRSFWYFNVSGKWSLAFLRTETQVFFWLLGGKIFCSNYLFFWWDRLFFWRNTSFSRIFFRPYCAWMTSGWPLACWPCRSATTRSSPCTDTRPAPAVSASPRTPPSASFVEPFCASVKTAAWTRQPTSLSVWRWAFGESALRDEVIILLDSGTFVKLILVWFCFLCATLTV